MPNERNIKTVQELEDKIKSASALYFTRYTGMDVSQATELRREFRKNSIEYKISKNTLTKIAAVNAGYDSDKMSEFLNGQIGIAYADSDPTAPAKVIKDFIEENEDCLDVVGLIFDGSFFEADKYKQFADLPSKDELLTKFVVGLNSPMTKMSTMLNSVMVKMVTVLGGLKEKK